MRVAVVGEEGERRLGERKVVVSRTEGLSGVGRC